MSQRTLHSLRHCPDCGSEHLAAPCGMTFAERMRSVRTATEWMPAKQDDRRRGSTKGGKDYFDDEALKPMFGGDSAADRYEQLMDETQGVGVADQEDIAKYPELVTAHYLDNPKDELDG